MNIIKIDLPVIPLRGMTVLPGMVIHFDVSRKKSIKAVERAMANNQKIFLAAQHNQETAEPAMNDIFQTGTVAKIKQIIKMPNTLIRVLVEGLEKGFLCKLVQHEEMLIGKIEISGEEMAMPCKEEAKAMVLLLREQLKNYAAANPKTSKEIIKQLLHLESIDGLLNRIAVDFSMDYLQRQQFLEADSIQSRFEYIAGMLAEDTDIYIIKTQLLQKVREKVDKNQKDYIIREQLKVLHEELGEEDYASEAEEFFGKIEALEASFDVKARLVKEVKRYNAMAHSSAEGNVLRGYIETCLELPWDKRMEDNRDLSKAMQVLEKDHHGLKKVKERIVEYLAVRLATEKAASSIICLVGPPGTGKTSIAKSIASALDKKYVRICLGGVRDEAEIRGHRKTYVGAMPGRIVTGLRSAGVKNPLMLLDEIDKMSSDYKGDTASAMLEVLDGEQNEHFTDHYIEMPVDLSEVLFIATANDLHTIPRPLLDRMEVIEINSYTENEKFHIARDYLVEKQTVKNGLTPKNLTFNDKAIHTMIRNYTREAGVRGLERRIAEVCRKAVKEQMISGKKKAVKITERNLEHYLGKKKYEPDQVNKKDDVGLARGLAWTSVGGDTLQIEVNIYPGKGELKLTGQMGEVMKESAMIALSSVRSIVSQKPFRISPQYFEKNEIHLHIPEGAVPKDGPSAGITMATAIFSAITGKKVRADVAMTGEVTLRGRVLAIGGLKEKMLAAKNAGVKTVLVPWKNKKDVLEFDAEITEGMEICYVQDMRQVLSVALSEKQ